MGDQVVRTRAVTPGAILDEFATAVGAKCEIAISQIDIDGCAIKIQSTNVNGVGDLLEIRRIDAPSGPHVFSIPVDVSATVRANGSLRMTCIADAGQSGPFRVTYSFRWLV
jgi:hypothetical protein